MDGWIKKKLRSFSFCLTKDNPLRLQIMYKFRIVFTLTLSDENYSRINNIILHAASKYSKILLCIEQILFVILIQKINIEYCIANIKI